MRPCTVKTSIAAVFFVLLLSLPAGCSAVQKAELKGIRYSRSAAELQPSFHPDVTEYLIAPVQSTAEGFLFDGFTLPRGASLTINGESRDGGAYRVEHLEPGPNVLNLEVKNRRGSIREYSLTIYRALPVYKAQPGDAGRDLPAERFESRGDGTVLDRKTGLVWLQDADPAGLVSWEDARRFILDLNSGEVPGNCGYSDWRLPNIREIRSLQNYREANTADWLGKYGFRNIQATCWTSTTYSNNTDMAWIGLFTNAHIVQTPLKTHANYVWPVRSESRLARTGSHRIEGYDPLEWEDGSRSAGIPWPEPRFLDNRDGTVTDNMTGLVWLQNGGLCGIVPRDEAARFLDAFNTPSAVGNAGHTDWRIPTVNELESLICFGEYDGKEWLMMPEQGFENIRYQYWSCTPSLEGYHWTMLTLNGLITHNYGSLGNSLWPVRSLEQP